MNRISLYFLVLTITVLFTCSDADAGSAPTITQSFVRFNFLVDNNNIPLEFPQQHGSLIPQSSYENALLKTLKIPITLTTANLSQPISVTFSTTLSSGLTAEVVTISPENTVTFEGTQLTDTIYVDFQERWTPGESIFFKLESVSDSSINIGNLNSEAVNDTFLLQLENIEPSFSFETNRLEINGLVGEEVFFDVLFPEGYLDAEIEGIDIFEALDGFNYSLEPINLGSLPTSITYKMTINEDLQNDDVFYQTILTLSENTEYNPTGNTVLQIVKPINTFRDPAVNTAANFYDVSNTFYRTFGEAWGDHNNTGTCRWFSFSAFTRPVVVDVNHPNAVLFDDMGTPDPSDDIYHDAFRIGFRSPTNPNVTTNSFNMKRWFSNESTNFANSPGFDVNPALEFFPDNGTSNFSGTVLVIPQFITIAGTNGNSYSIAISGEGSYQDIGNGLYEMTLTLNATNDQLFGGTISVEYRIYNNQNYPEPEPLNYNNCITEYDL